jgi:hypothetical protein
MYVAKILAESRSAMFKELDGVREKPLLDMRN